MAFVNCFLICLFVSLGNSGITVSTSFFSNWYLITLLKKKFTLYCSKSIAYLPTYEQIKVNEVDLSLAKLLLL